MTEVPRRPAPASQLTPDGGCGRRTTEPTATQARRRTFPGRSVAASLPLSPCSILQLPALALILAVSAVSACAPGADQARSAAHLRETVTLELQPYFRDLRSVRVSDGTSQLTLLLDTGGGATLITPAVAERRGCSPYGRVIGHRMTGERVEFRQCDDITLSAGRWRQHFNPIAVFDVNALLPPELPRLDGVLALDAFRGQVVTIDWPGAQITVHEPRDADIALRLHGLPVRFATGDTGRMFSALVPATSSRGRLWFLLDSGNLRGTLVDQAVVQAGLLTLDSDGTVALALGRRPPARTSVTATDLIIDGALGASFLLQGAVALDLRASGSEP